MKKAQLLYVPFIFICILGFISFSISAHSLDIVDVDNAFVPFVYYKEGENVLYFHFGTRPTTGVSWTIPADLQGATPEWSKYAKEKGLEIVSVVIDESMDVDTYQPTSMADWFDGLSDLKTVTGLSNIHADQLENTGYLFNDCTSLVELDISPLDTTHVKDMHGMFRNCSSLELLDTSGFNTENLVTAEGMFQGCASLENLDVFPMNTVNLIYMNDMFNDCKMLKNLDLDNFNTANVQGMNEVFMGCTSLTSLDLTSFDTSSVQGMASMFANCSSLEELDLSNFSAQNLGTMSTMFFGCSHLLCVDLSGMKVSSKLLAKNMFGNCSALQRITLPQGFSATDDLPLVGASGRSGRDGGAWFVYDDETKEMVELEKIQEEETTNTIRVWQKNHSDISNTYGISFNVNFDNAGGSPTTKTAIAYCGYPLDTQGLGDKPVYSGHIFSGYFTNSSGGARYIDENMQATFEWEWHALGDKVTLFAHWDEGAYVIKSAIGDTFILQICWSKKPTSGTYWAIPSSLTTTPAWSSDDVTRVYFDESLHYVYLPHSCAWWFQGLTNVISIEGSHNIDTSAATSFAHMFEGDSSIQYLDLRYFEMSETATQDNMFSGMSGLQLLSVGPQAYMNATTTGLALPQGGIGLWSAETGAVNGEYMVKLDTMQELFRWHQERTGSGFTFDTFANSYIITLDPNGGTSGDTLNIVGYFGYQLPALTIKQRPTKKENYFLGFFLGDTVESTCFYTHTMGATAAFWEPDAALIATPVLKALWTGAKVTVTFDADKGHWDTAFGPENTKTQNGYIGELLTPPSEEPILEGHDLKGWDPEIIDGKTRYSTSQVLYKAVWVKTIVFDANGGTFTDGSQTKTTITLQGQDADSLSWSNVSQPSWNKNKFMGWSTSPTGQTPATEPGTFENADIKYYAIWSTSITFYANGGTFDSHQVTKTITQPSYTAFDWSDAGGLTWVNLNFAGWGVTADSTVAAETPVRYGDADIAYYALWQKDVSFYANGGTFAGGKESISVSNMANVDFDWPDITGLEWGNCILEGWGISSDASRPVSAPSKYKDAISAYYAIWSNTVTFDANGGTFANGSSTLTIARNGFDDFSFSDTGSLYWGTKRLVGWGETPTATVPVTPPHYYGNAVATYYAIWENEVTFYANGGVFADGEADHISTRNVNSPFEWPSTEEISYGDYVLLGWGTSASATTPVATPTTYGKAARYYYAIWAKDITFDANGGTFKDGETERVVQGALSATFTWPQTSNVSYGSYKLAGWALERDDISPVDKPQTYANAETTYYAVWDNVVTFDANGGVFTNGDSQMISEGALTTAFAWPNNSSLLWGSYKLVGWGLSRDATEPLVKPQTYANAGSVYYAIWESTITFDANGGVFEDGTSQLEMEGVLNSPFEWPSAEEISYDDYILLGWGTSASDTVPVATPTTYAQAKSHYYAIWESPVPKNQITFDALEGYWDPGHIEELHYAGDEGTVVPQPPAPVYPGYEVDYWATDTGIRYVENVTLFTSFPMTFYAHYKLTPGWHNDANGWRYVNEQSNMLVSCWATIDEGRYYFDASGYRVENCWKNIDGKWYNFMPNGIVRTDWYWDVPAHGWYYFDETGAMQTGWTLVRNTWYYMDGSGLMKTGWFWDTNNWSWYYLRDNGAMESGCWSWIANKWYGFYANGKMCTGWTWDDYYAGWFWCDITSGAMQTGWLEVNGIWYYLEHNGLMQTGWLEVNGVWYYLTQSGAMAVGWQQVRDEWYYLSPFAPQGAMVSGWQTINGSKYYFNTSGAMVHDKMVDGHWLRSDGRGW